jgi:hypothetical protein
MSNPLNLSLAKASMIVRSGTLESEQEALSLLNTYQLDEKGNAVTVEERLKDATNLRAIHAHLSDEDRSRERNRAKVQAMVDYKPPYDPALMRERGRSSDFNVNFGEGAAVVNESVNGYVDLFTSTQTLIHLPLKYGTTEYNNKIEWENIIAEEFTSMVRGWDKAQFSFLELVNTFVTHGVAVGMLPDKLSWHFNAASLSNFKFPERSKAISSEVEICTCSEFLTPAQLSEHIQNEALATEKGWNVEEVKRVIARSANVGTGRDGYDTQNYEQLEEKIKANSHREGTVYNTIEIIRCWSKEHDGKVSYYVCTVDAFNSKEEKEDKFKDFLFRERGCYDNMRQAMHLFPFFTGTNGNIHSIRGLGHMVYPQVQASNLMQCSMLDSAREAMSTKYTMNGDKDLENMPIIQSGTATLIPSYLTVVPQAAPDLQRSAMPAMNLLSSQIGKHSSASSLSDVLDNTGKERRGNFEVQAAVEHFSSINAAAMRLFFKPWRELLVEMARRAFRKEQDEKTEAGADAKRLRQRCINRGVPEEVFADIDFDEAAVRMPIGLGNAAARNSLFAQGTALLPEMDDVGRKQFAVDRAVHLFGPEVASEYINTQTVPRQPFDKKIAEMENNQMLAGMQVEIDTSENFLVHLRIHVGKMWELHGQYEEGQADLIPVVQQMIPIFEHTAQTFSIAVVPDVDEPELQGMKQSLQQLNEIIQNGQKAMQKLEREQQEQQAQEQPQQQEQGPDPKAIEGQVKLQQMVQKHELEMAIAKQEHEQKMILLTQEAATKTAIKDTQTANLVRSTPIDQ